MTERDRLAADLHEVIAGVRGLGDRPDLWLASADRLIARGWTRAETCDPPCGDCCVEHPHWTHWHSGDHICAGFPCGTCGAGLDEERLARALERHYPVTYEEGDAAAIAKAYREDAG